MPAVWIVKRNCSAGPRALALVFVSLAAVSFAIGAGFAAFGLWLVLPFVGVEMLAVAAAFFVYARHATDYERIEIADSELRVTQIDGREQRHWHWPVAWARVEREEQGTAHPRVCVGAFGARVEIGRHLPAARRLALADEIGAALQARAHGFAAG